MRKSEMQAVVETEAGVYLLFIRYEDGEGANAIGNVYRISGQRNDSSDPTQLLATSDTLRTMWASPSGAVWVGSADGNVGTTANVNWSRPPHRARYRTLAGSASWSATALPPLNSNGLRPNVTLLWGIDDDCVFAAAYGGHIYFWDGSTWRQVHDGGQTGGAAISAFGGQARDDVFAVGTAHTILHFDGKTWSAMATPAPVHAREHFSGVRCQPSGETFICSSISSDEGRLLAGSSSGFVEIARCKMQLIAMAALGDRLLFATGDSVAELIAGVIVPIRSTFKMAAMTPGLGRLFFIEPAPAVPSFIMYEPQFPDAPFCRFAY